MSVTQIEHYFPVSVPLTPLSTFMGRWVFGEALCKLLPASQVICDVANHDCNRKSWLFLMRIGSSLLVFLFKVQRWMLACLTSIFSWAKFTLIWHVVGIWANLSSACPVHFKSWIQGVCWKKSISINMKRCVLQGTSVYLSTFTLTAIALDRCLVMFWVHLTLVVGCPFRKLWLSWVLGCA